MLENNGGLSRAEKLTLTDEDLWEIQRQHFGRKTEEQAKKRSAKSLANCLDALAAFREITGLKPISRATPDDCSKFQQVCKTLPNTWRRKRKAERRPVKFYSETAREQRRKSGKLDPLDEVPRYSPNNILRWSRSLQAAFERVNHNALKRKCVRGVVAPEKLLISNPWNQFTWIEVRKPRPKRQFDGSELVSLLDHLAEKWDGVPIAITMAKVFLWSGCRKLEITGLSWDSLRLVRQRVPLRDRRQVGRRAAGFVSPRMVYQETAWLPHGQPLRLRCVTTGNCDASARPGQSDHQPVGRVQPEERLGPGSTTELPRGRRLWPRGMPTSMFSARRPCNTPDGARTSTVRLPPTLV